MTAARIWTIGAVALIAAILALGWFLGIAPLLAQKAAADTERANVEAQTAAQQAQLQIMKTDFENLDTILADLEPLQTSIPGYEGVELFAAYVESVAASHGITVTSYVASEMPYGGAIIEGEAGTTSSGTGGPALTTAAGTVYALPIAIGFEGTPEAFTDAVRTLQSSPRLFLVQNVTFARGSAGGTPSATIVGYLFLITDRVLASGSDQVATAPTGTEAVPGQSYQVPDMGELLPDWISGGGSSDPTPAPTPGMTSSPTPTATPSG